MHFINGRKCEVKKALPRDDESLTSSCASTSKSQLCAELLMMLAVVFSSGVAFKSDLLASFFQHFGCGLTPLKLTESVISSFAHNVNVFIFIIVNKFTF